MVYKYDVNVKNTLIVELLIKSCIGINQFEKYMGKKYDQNLKSM